MKTVFNKIALKSGMIELTSSKKTDELAQYTNIWGMYVPKYVAQLQKSLQFHLVSNIML